jgi:hypothetical protein
VKFKKNQKNAPLPPANTAIPWFGSEVAAMFVRATLRLPMLQEPLVLLKMSTVLKTVMLPPERYD